MADIELREDEVECVEIAGDQSIPLNDLEKLLPALKSKYGARAVLRFTGVAIAPSNPSKRRGTGYGNVTPQ